MPRVYEVKPTPEKFCRHCGVALGRKRMNGRLEDRGVFLRRQFCDQTCMAKAMEKETCTSVSHSRMKANRTMKPSCEACNATGKLHVHHKDENPLNNDPSNLKTLCVSCHRRSHSPNFTATGEQRAPCAHCAKQSVKVGLCATHLTRLRRFGHPLAKKRKIGSAWVLMLHDGNLWFPFPS